ncbi:MAG: hypothetical protein IJ131_02865 [Eggerthellaceae bacterium]|nr:hypothetical protein [Eggerthellaceae bacterium]
MDAKSLKKLNRRELLEILVQLSEQNDELKEENESLKARLADRKIDAQEVGSIAQAALEANGYFKAAEEAAQQYLENIARIQSETEAECQAMLDEVNRMVAQAEQATGRKSTVRTQAHQTARTSLEGSAGEAPAPQVAGTQEEAEQSTGWQNVLEGETN